MAKVIAVYNRKGGVGKTTSLLNLGAEFALLGKKVLLVDGDSQMNLTQYFFSDELDIEIGIDPNECILSQGRTKPVIMNESLADFEMLSDFRCSEEILPTMHSLQENTKKGYVYVPSFGGGTSDTEYEVLIQNSFYQVEELLISYIAMSQNMV